MVLFTATYTLHYLIEVLLVGLSGFALAGAKLETMNHWKAILVFTAIFGILDTYWLPTVADLDISVVVGNRDAREFFNLPDGPVHFSYLFGFGFIDVIIWFVCGIFAYFGGLFLFRNVTKLMLAGR